MKFTWYGHSNFKIESPEATIFIDPWFEGNPKAPCSAEQAGRPDYVLLTHDHGDHLGQAIEICQMSGAPLVGVFDTVNSLIERGLPAEQGMGMNIGGTVEVAGIQIKMVQAVHSTATGAPTGYIVTWPDGFCIYHSGDTGLFASMKLFDKFHDISVAILPIDGHFNMDPQQAAYACKLLGCRKVVPMHWGTFPILEPDTKRFAEQLALNAPDTEMQELVIGQATEVN